MILFLILLAALVLWRSEWNLSGFQSDYISPAHILPIKGVFVLLIFASHWVTYLNLSGPCHDFYFWVRRYLGQLIVVPFLFYSGYGLCLSFEEKGKSYHRTFPVRRLLRLIFQFQFAVVLYALIQLFRKEGTVLTAKRIVLSLLGWESLGNSNWYVFAIVLLYAISWVAFLFGQKYRRTLPYLIISVLTFVLMLLLMPYRPDYCYNTLFAYVAGCWFYFFREKAETILFKFNRVYLLFLLLVLELFIAFHQRWNSLLFYQLTAIAFGILLVMVSAKFTIHNRFLDYCGTNVFGIYILQRIPMLLLQNTWAADIAWLYFVLCFAATALLTAAVNRFLAWAWPLLERRIMTAAHQ